MMSGTAAAHVADISADAADPVWELTIQRLAHDERDGRVRTYGSYSLAIGGVPQPTIAGSTCEAPGPGDNGREGKDRRRAREGRYPLCFHWTARYRTCGFEDDPEGRALHPLPCIEFLLPEPRIRTGLLIHPAHPSEAGARREGLFSDLFLSSIGCVNLTSAISPDQEMDYADSRARVLAILASLDGFVAEGLRSCAPDSVLPRAFLTLTGEPTSHR